MRKKKKCNVNGSNSDCPEESVEEVSEPRTLGGREKKNEMQYRGLGHGW